MSNSSILIVSVESRKGGVGKTTAALSLAKALVSRSDADEWAVLLLDGDVTGTNTADVLKHSLWNESCTAVEFAVDGRDWQLANLLDLFEGRFMAGMGVPNFLVGERATGDLGEDETLLKVKRGSINVLGSQIFSSDDANVQRLVCSPSVLFDELHGSLFVEFISDLCGQFADAMSGYANRLAVVVDNSPGYVGLAPAIHEWLTDLGPDVGKFLTIASVDGQDLMSCMRSVRHVRDMYESKWLTAQNLYGRGGNGQKVDKQFALRLVEAQQRFDRRVSRDSALRSWAGADSSTVSLPRDLAYYREQSAERTSGPTEPGRFQSLVLNRIPRHLLRDGAFSANILPLHHRWFDKTIKSLLAVRHQDDPIGNCVPDLPFLRGNQFAIVESQFEGFSNPSDDLAALLDTANDLRNIEALQWETIPELSLWVSEADSYIERGLRILGNSGFEELANSFSTSWFPSDAVAGFQEAIASVTGVISDRRSLRRALDILRLSDGDQEKVDGLWIELQTELDSGHESAMAMFAPSTRAIVTLVAPVLRFAESGLVLFQHLVSEFMKIETLHWENVSDEEFPEGGIVRFLAGDSMTDVEIDEILMRHEARLPGSFDRASLRDLYCRWTLLQSRLMDVSSEVFFLLKVMEIHADLFFSHSSRDGRLRSSSSFLTSKIEQVVIRKEVSFVTGHEEYFSDLLSHDYFESFVSVLRRVLRDQWGVNGA